MIALLKLFKKQKVKEGVSIEVTRAQPFALYNNGILEVLDEEEINYHFPNNGKIFVPDSFQIPQKDTFSLFELSEMNNFDETRYTSMKYKVRREIYNINLYEVIDLDEAITTEKLKIVDKLMKGIYIPYHVTSPILFRTNDDLIIGPVQMEFVDGLYMIKNKNLNFIPYYQQEVDIIVTFDEYKNQERLFCTNTLSNNNIKGWIDVCTEQQIISEALKQLKANTEFGELSRKNISILKSWYESDGSMEIHIKERLHRAIQIMESNTLDDETVQLFKKLFLDLAIVNDVIAKQTEEKFKKEYEKFLKENNELVKECEKQKIELSDLEIKRLEVSEALRQGELNYNIMEKKLKEKMGELHNNFASVYAEQLTLSGFMQIPSLTYSASNRTVQNFVQYQSVEGKELSDFLSFVDNLKENLSHFNRGANITFLAAAVFTAIILEEPIIIYGEYSYELAQCIAKTMTSKQTLSIIPEIDYFSLDDLRTQYNQYSQTNELKSFIVHNPHISAAMYSLPAYFKQNKWLSNEYSIDLILIAIDSLEEANTFMEKMLYKPLINSKDYIKRNVNKRTIKSIHPSQVNIKAIENTALEDYSVNIRRDFREWVEDNINIDITIPYQLVEWLNQLGAFLEEDVLFKESYKVFENSFIESEKLEA